MTIFKTAILPYKRFFTDLKNNLSIKVLISLILYGLFLLYSGQVIDRVVASGNKNTLVILRFMVYIQQLPAIFFFAFCLKKIYITILHSESFISKINTRFNIGENPNRTFRLFIIYTFLAHIVLSSLSALTNYDFAWLILAFILFPGYFVIFPAFALIERPPTTYRQSVLLINKEIYNKKTQLILVTFITAAIFLFAQTIVRNILAGFMAYKIVQSNGQDATTGLMLSTVGLYDFITGYLGMIIYVKLSLILYLKFKVQISDREFT